MSNSSPLLPGGVQPAPRSGILVDCKRKNAEKRDTGARKERVPVAAPAMAPPLSMPKNPSPRPSKWSLPAAVFSLGLLFLLGLTAGSEFLCLALSHEHPSSQREFAAAAPTTNDQRSG